jgi:hypothetical protein
MRFLRVQCKFTKKKKGALNYAQAQHLVLEVHRLSRIRI